MAVLKYIYAYLYIYILAKREKGKRKALRVKISVSFLLKDFRNYELSAKLSSKVIIFQM